MNGNSSFKRGIQTKAFIYMSGMFAIFILIVVLLCMTTFEGFVNVTRKNDVKNAYKIINKLPVSEYSENNEILRELTYKYNLRIVIKNKELSTVFSNMFPAEKNYEPDFEAARKCAADLLEAADEVENIIFVSDYIYSDAELYGELTQKYRKILAETDRKLAAECDVVIEAVCGSYITHKGEMPK